MYLLFVSPCIVYTVMYVYCMYALYAYCTVYVHQQCSGHTRASCDTQPKQWKKRWMLEARHMCISGLHQKKGSTDQDYLSKFKSSASVFTILSSTVTTVDQLVVRINTFPYVQLLNFEVALKPLLR